MEAGFGCVCFFRCIYQRDVGGVLKNMEAGVASGAGFNMEAGFGGRFQYGGSFRVSFNMEAGFGGSFQY
jgi:hypothetical protein